MAYLEKYFLNELAKGRVYMSYRKDVQVAAFGDDIALPFSQWNSWIRLWYNARDLDVAILQETTIAVLLQHIKDTVYCFSASLRAAPSEGATSKYVLGWSFALCQELVGFLCWEAVLQSCSVHSLVAHSLSLQGFTACM